MSDESKKNNQTEDVLASLMKELNITEADLGSENISDGDSTQITENLELDDKHLGDLVLESTDGLSLSEDEKTQTITDQHMSEVETSIDNILNFEDHKRKINEQGDSVEALSEKTVALDAAAGMTQPYYIPTENIGSAPTEWNSESERTVAVSGFANRRDKPTEENIRISVGQTRRDDEYSPMVGSLPDSQLLQAEHLKLAQQKVSDLQKENEKLRFENAELRSAAEIIKERSDNLVSQNQSMLNDRDSLEISFKNELTILKGQLRRKEADLQATQLKVDELESRLKFDMKKIRVRERELENRLELIRAEKNALMKSKDEQLLDLRRKLDQVQMEVESYRQKCVDLNKSIEQQQDSFRRTTRALRLAMANLEAQEETKAPLKKAD